MNPPPPPAAVAAPIPTRRARAAGAALASAVLLAAASGGGAAELVQRDLMLEVGEMPTSFTYSISGAGPSHSGSDSFSSDLGLVVGGRYSFARAGDSSSVVVGASLYAQQATYQSYGHETGYGLRLAGGYGWAVTDDWSLGGRLEVGYGLSTFDLQANHAFSGLSTTGATLSYLAGLDVDYGITDRLTSYIDLSYQRWSTNFSGGGVTLKMTTSGFAFALGLAYRFSYAPRRVD